MHGRDAVLVGHHPTCSADPNVEPRRHAALATSRDRLQLPSSYRGSCVRGIAGLAPGRGQLLGGGRGAGATGSRANSCWGCSSGGRRANPAGQGASRCATRAWSGDPTADDTRMTASKAGRSGPHAPGSTSSGTRPLPCPPVDHLAGSSVAGSSVAACSSLLRGRQGQQGLRLLWWQAHLQCLIIHQVQACWVGACIGWVGGGGGGVCV
jgi:hypothetical protein